MSEALIRLRSRAGDPRRGRILAFPPSGAGPYYFRPLVGDGVEVWAARYPGRETRAAEPFAPHVTTIADELVPLVADVLGDDVPTMLLGHSMGVGVAVEVCRRLEAVRPGRVDLLALAARSAPGSVHRERCGELLSVAADRDRLRDWSASLYDIPAGLFDDADYMDLHLRTLRADLEISIRHDAAASGPIGDAPLLLVCGDADPVTGLPDMRGWAAVTEGPCTELALAGGHDAVVAQADRVRAWVPTWRRGRSL